MAYDEEVASVFTIVQNAEYAQRIIDRVADAYGDIDITVTEVPDIRLTVSGIPFFRIQTSCSIDFKIGRDKDYPFLRTLPPSDKGPVSHNIKGFDCKKLVDSDLDKLIEYIDLSYNNIKSNGRVTATRAAPSETRKAASRKNVSSEQFNTSHNNAFASFGAIKPGQHWSAFDVAIDDAENGKASRLVTSIWNRNSRKDESGKRVATGLSIIQDVGNGSLWYRIAAPINSTGESSTRKANWRRYQIAFRYQLPIIGILKDVDSSKLSLSNIFDCREFRSQPDGLAIWLKLEPRHAIGCEVRVAAIDEIINDGDDQIIAQPEPDDLEHEIKKSLQRSSEQRQLRLAQAPKKPTRSQKSTKESFNRNPDVIVEVLLRAKGNCEECGGPAPFIRQSNGTPYLEVHHITFLANDGFDTVENALALCPNCHRRAHYG